MPPHSTDSDGAFRRQFRQVRLRRVQLRGQLCQRLCLQVVAPGTVNADVVVLRLHVLDFFHRNHMHLVAVTNENAGRTLAGIPSALILLAPTLLGRQEIEALLIDMLG